MLTAFSHTSRVLKLSGTYLNDHGSTSGALIHICCVLKISGMNAKERGFLRTLLLHAFWTIGPTTGVYFSVYNKRHPNGFLNESVIFIYILRPQARVKFYGQNADHFEMVILSMQKTKQLSDASCQILWTEHRSLQGGHFISMENLGKHT